MGVNSALPSSNPSPTLAHAIVGTRCRGLAELQGFGNAGDLMDEVQIVQLVIPFLFASFSMYKEGICTIQLNDDQEQLPS